MAISFTRWPEELAARYREKGYWADLPLTDILTRHAANDAIALIDGERHYSYRELEQAATRLACALQKRGLNPGDTALVQLGNVAEFYITLFALLKIGVAPVNALFSHQRTELEAYALQIEPAALIADRKHNLFAHDDFLDTLCARNPSLRMAVLLNENERERSLSAFISEPADNFTATPCAAAEVAFKAVEPELMRAVTKGVLHKNAASRKVSRLAKKLKSLSA